MNDAAEVWVYLSASPLLHLTMTLVAFQAGDLAYRRSGGHPLLNPVMIAVLLLSGILLASGTDYDIYFEGAQFVHFLLGPATVALAIPLYNQFRAIRKSAAALLASLALGSLSAAGSAGLIAWWMGAGADLIASLAPKSATTPIAMGVAEQLGGLPSLTAALVIMTGILGAAFGPWLLDLVRVRDEAARGLALGVASHGIGAARALQSSETAGAFAGVAIGVNGLLTAALAPLIWRSLF